MRATPSALISEKGQRVQLRVLGRFYQLSQDELRTVLGIPAGPPGLGITVDRDRLQFEFEGQPIIELTEKQLKRLLSRQPAKES